MSLEQVHAWCHDPYFDPITRLQAKQLEASPELLREAFEHELSFGTGGLRAPMGVGTARLNVYTVRKMTQALARYLLSQNNAQKGVVVGFDNRHNSHLFAQETARVLAGHGIPVFLSLELRPTPFIAFMCRFLGARAAVMITASHNPKEYNGYKVYGEDGGQVVSPHDRAIEQAMRDTPSYTEIPIAPLDHPLITYLGAEEDAAYLDTVASLWILQRSRGLRSSYDPLRICYSSLHGTGVTLLPKALERCGFPHVSLVPKQCIPDPDFTTTQSPNPETHRALELGLAWLETSKSDLLLVTDPDADRVGVAVMHQGQPHILNGHELAALATDYICAHSPCPPTLITTVVTTPLLDAIAQSYGTHVERVLTGFKHIGQKISEQTELRYVLGAEESLGFLIGDYCRDKDGISAACLFASIAATLKARGLTCVDGLHALYARFGVFQEQTLSLEHPAPSAFMETMRNHPPQIPILHTLDYQQGYNALPPTNMLQWTLEGGTTLFLRPSGTEPRIKAYLTTHRPPHPDVARALQGCRSNLAHLASSLTHLLEPSLAYV